MEKKLLLFLLFFGIFVSCSDETFETDNEVADLNQAEFSQEPDSSHVASPSYLRQMIFVEDDSTTVILGTDGKNALESEKPAMNVKLNYDYFMDSHEVTCGEYASVLDGAGMNAPRCENDRLPISNVTFYDAVLFANAKSKASKIDTVYEYSEAVFDDENHCTYLSGFSFKPDREGFRLPTEAEWIKAASIHWDSTKSWNSDNSNFKPHAVCTAPKNTALFCDFAGNVMEWVNDWLGKFKDTTVVNYVGAPDGGDLGERILKGGSFNSSPTSINRFSRGDVYTVTSSTRADYVGFRLAFGAIPNPLWIASDGKVAESIVTPLANPSQVRELASSYNVKLTFRNDVTGNLNFIDYSSGTESVTEISDTLNVYHPEISPDGNKVAFCTKFEGIEGVSSLYVRDLNKEGSNLTKLDVKGAAIPRWNILENGDTVITYVSDAGVNSESSTWKSYSTWQVPFSNGKFGKPVKIFDGSFHGGIATDNGNKLAVTGARLLRTNVNGTDELWYNGEQACNASLAQDGSKRTAFLDFGGKTGREFVGKRYGVHQQLLVTDSTGKLIQAIEAPAGYTFDHSEWAVGEVNDNVVATLANVNGVHQKIALVSLKDSSTLELAEGDELWHPCLWTKKKIAPVTPEDVGDSTEQVFVLDPDSAGVYYVSGGDYIAARWRYKMELLWQYKDSANVVILGSSRALLGLNPMMIREPYFAINLANTSNIKHGSKYIFHNYVIPHVKNLKYVIISLDLDRWYHDDSYSFFYNTYKNFPGYVYDANHNFWNEEVPKQLFQKTYESLGWKKYEASLRNNRGYQTTSSNGWEQEDVPIKKDSLWLEKNDKIFNKHYNHLIDIIAEAETHNIKVIAVEFPESPAYQNTGSYGKYGLRRSQMPEILEKITNISNTYPNFIFIDENKMGNHDYTDEMAQNADHLATHGAQKMGIKIDSLLRTLE